MVTKIFSDGADEQVVLTGLAALMLHALISGAPRHPNGSVTANFDIQSAMHGSFKLAEAFMAEAKERAK